MSEYTEKLREWNETKDKIARLEENIEKLKLFFSKEMYKRNTEEITDGKYTLTRRRISKKTISKSCLPRELWDKYAVRCNYDAFYLSKSRKDK